jgi:hypothetical protein
MMTATGTSLSSLPSVSTTATAGVDADEDEDDDVNDEEGIAESSAAGGMPRAATAMVDARLKSGKPKGNNCSP